MACKTQSEFVTPDEAASIKGCGRSTIYAAIARGELVPVHRSMKLLRRRDVEEYVVRPVGAPSRQSQAS